MIHPAIINNLWFRLTAQLIHSSYINKVIDAFSERFFTDSIRMRNEGIISIEKSQNIHTPSGARAPLYVDQLFAWGVPGPLT